MVPASRSDYTPLPSPFPFDRTPPRALRPVHFGGHTVVCFPSGRVPPPPPFVPAPPPGSALRGGGVRVGRRLLLHVGRRRHLLPRGPRPAQPSPPGRGRSGVQRPPTGWGGGETWGWGQRPTSGSAHRSARFIVCSNNGELSSGGWRGGESKACVGLASTNAPKFCSTQAGGATLLITPYPL